MPAPAAPAAFAFAAAAALLTACDGPRAADDEGRCVPVPSLAEEGPDRGTLTVPGFEIDVAIADCTDGKDNDCDGLIDGEELHCTPFIDEADCANGVDDDQNGLNDCEDESCMGGPGCAPLLRVLHIGGTGRRSEGWSIMAGMGSAARDSRHTVELSVPLGFIEAARADGGVDRCRFEDLHIAAEHARSWDGYLAADAGAGTLTLPRRCPFGPEIFADLRVDLDTGGLRWRGAPRASWPAYTWVVERSYSSELRDALITGRLDPLAAGLHAGSGVRVHREMTTFLTSPVDTEIRASTEWEALVLLPGSFAVTRGDR